MFAKRLALTALCALTLAGSALAQTQGVQKDSITIGTIQDLSGPISSLGKQVRDGMLMRVDEINAQGGINGRKLVLKVEDSGYDPKRGVLAAQKLVNENKVFAIVGDIGTAVNVATFPVLFKKKIINFLPLSGAREMFDPPHRDLKYGFSLPYFDQIRSGLPRLAKEKHASKVCVMYQDDDFGQEVLRGTEAGLKTLNLPLVEKTSYKRGDTDFSSQIARLKASGCDLVVLGTVVRETIGAIATARKIGFSPTFLGSSAAYMDLIHKLGGSAMDGFYATMFVNQPYADSSSEAVRAGVAKYKQRFNDDPGVFSVYGYEIVDAFAKGAERAGANLTLASFTAAMESSPIPSDIFGSDTLTFSATDRQGSKRARISQIQNGRWKVVADYSE
jgi:branched-chain amino acid transport system substrate-binding protein